MSIKTFLMSVLFAATPTLAHAAVDSLNDDAAEAMSSDGTYSTECHHGQPGGYYPAPGGYYGPRDDCRNYNRDGITCQQVGFYEGQSGAPWGYGAGQFRCTNGCLQWVGW